MAMIVKSITGKLVTNKLFGIKDRNAAVTGIPCNKEKIFPNTVHTKKIIYTLNQANLLWPFSF